MASKIPARCAVVPGRLAIFIILPGLAFSALGLFSRGQWSLLTVSKSRGTSLLGYDDIYHKARRLGGEFGRVVVDERLEVDVLVRRSFLNTSSIAQDNAHPRALADADCVSAWSPDPPECKQAAADIKSSGVVCAAVATCTINAVATGTGTCQCFADQEVKTKECISGGVCPAPSSAVTNTYVKGLVQTASVTSCGTMAAKAKTCSVKASKEQKPAAYNDMKSGIDPKPMSKLLAASPCKKADLLSHGINTGATKFPALGGFVLVPLLLFAWLMGSCLVTARKCRRMWPCCKERREISPISVKKRVVIIMFSFIGFGGMLALRWAGVMGDVTGGASSADGATCAANAVVDAMLNGGSGTGGFIGLGPAATQVADLAKEIEEVLALSAEANSNDYGFLQAATEAEVILQVMTVQLCAHAMVPGQPNTFCEQCCTGGANSLLSRIQSNDAVPTLFQNVRKSLFGGALDQVQFELSTAGTSLDGFSFFLEAGPAGAVINSGDFFKSPLFGQFSMLSGLVGQPCCLIGLLAMFYGLKICCCCRKCRIGQKMHPAPQCVAVGWCGGCLAAVTALLAAVLAGIVGFVSAEFCYIIEQVESTAAVAGIEKSLGLEGVAGTGAVACLSSSGSGDLGAALSINQQVSALKDLNDNMGKLFGADLSTFLADYDKLFTAPAPPWDGALTCYVLEWTPNQNSFRELLSLRSYGCVSDEFASKALALATAAKARATNMRAAQNNLKAPNSKWKQINDKLAKVRGDAVALGNSLDCSVAKDSWKALSDEVCTGLVTDYMVAGQAWLFIGVTAFVGSIAQYKLWRHLRDNRSLWWADHEEEKPKGVRKWLACFLAVGVGSVGNKAVDEDQGSGSAKVESDKKGEKTTISSNGGDVVVEKLISKFNEAFDFSVEESVKSFLAEDVFPSYASAFVSVALNLRVSAWRAAERAKKANKGGMQEVPKPEDPAFPKLEEFFGTDMYTDFDSEGFPKADANGVPLDKSTAAKLRKEFNICKKFWDKHEQDLKQYHAWLLYKARRERLEVKAEIEYPEDILHLRPISEKSKRPMQVLISKVPADLSKALFLDELKQITCDGVDPKARKDKTTAAAFKGLNNRCFDKVKDAVSAKMVAASSSDPSIWGGVVKGTPQKKGQPKPPKEPKGLVDPKELFKSGKEASKYSDFDAEGMPQKTSDESEIPDKELAALKKKLEKAKQVWDKHEEAKFKYEQALSAWKAANGGDAQASDDEVPQAIKDAKCETAGRRIVDQMIQKLVEEKADELCVEINRGEKDPEELTDVTVLVDYREEEIITDPLLKALRKFDPEYSNKISLDIFREYFDALADDELEVSTHDYLATLENHELEWAKGTIADLGINDEGYITYDDLKRFLEDQDVSEVAGNSAQNLVSCIMDKKVQEWMANAEVTQLWNPRKWRAQLADTGATDGDQRDEEIKDKRDNAVELPNAELDDEARAVSSQKAKKEKSDKKDKKEDEGTEAKDRKEKKDKKDDADVEEKAKKKEKKEKKEKDDGDATKKDKKEKKDKKDKRE